MSNKTRKAYTAEEKVTILRRHLIDQVPISGNRSSKSGWLSEWKDPMPTSRVRAKGKGSGLELRLS